MRVSTKRIAFIGQPDLQVIQSLREHGYRTEVLLSSSAFELGRELLRLKPSAIHAQKHHLKAALLGRLFGTPVLLQVSGEDLSKSTARAARLADRVLCGGATVREALLALGAPASTTCILRSLLDVNSDLQAAQVFPPMLDPATRWVVAATPADGPDRGHQDLILAFMTVARSRPKLKLLIAGDGPEAAKMRAQAERAGMLSRIIVHPVSREQLPSVFAHAAAVVGPSRSGAMPDPLPEALAVGAPVIATAVGSHTTWIREGRTGWLVPARAPVALAARLALVVDDHLTAMKIGQNARNAAIELAAPRAVAQELSRCYAAMSRPQALLGGVYLPQAPRSLRHA
jgi:glycosyltransferase involved in cell wall biosynthesis